MSNQPKTIAYITEVFPNLTQTFVYREIQALRRRGVQIRTFSIWRPELETLSAEALPYVNETVYIFPLIWLTLAQLHLWYLISRPARYLGTLIYMMTRPGESLHNRKRTIGHFLYGLVAIREMARLQIDHIHAHFGGSASSIALMANRFLNIPFSITLHAHGIFLNPLLLKAKLQRAQFIVTISEYNRQFLKQRFPNDTFIEKIKIVHCGLDSDTFAPAPQAAHQNGDLNIVSVGQLDPRKGFHFLIEACHHLAERGVQYHCHILGEGGERARLEALVEQYGLREKVFLPGRVRQEELRQYLSHAHVSVLACTQDKSGEVDGIPVALMETMAMEIPTVSTRISGIPELIEHERNGLLVPPDDPQALADALEQLKDASPAWRQALARAGRETIVNEFNIYSSAEQMSQLFEQLVLTSPTTPSEWSVERG